MEGDIRMLKHSGFYAELDELLECDMDADFGFLENESAGCTDKFGDEMNAYDYLHGCCTAFALCLHKKFGYPMMAVYDDEGELVHAYCINNINGITVYIDVRGCTESLEEMIGEFADFVTVTEDEPADVREFIPNPEDESFVGGAESLIADYMDYYNTDSRYNAKCFQ